jgi:hypothetical protein
MWILKNSKDVWGIYNQGPSPPAIAFKHLTSTLYTTIPHSKLKDRLKELVQLCFITKKNGQHRYKYLFLERDKSYFAKKTNTDSAKKVL